MRVASLFLLVLGCTVLRFLKLFCPNEHILSLAKPLSLSQSQVIFVLLCADCMRVFVLTHLMCNQMTDMPTDVHYMCMFITLELKCERLTDIFSVCTVVLVV